VVVAFVDERQILRRAEAGTLDYFRRHAIDSGMPPDNIHGPMS
jgi:hypothetical protein